ncbi:IS5 family transposase [Gordonia polyisoprenivorans]|uniref:IS5 family transposase n=1 Tax=Gordonia polyisoprenivorans TaxID=84595 RepID=UPI0030CE66F0
MCSPRPTRRARSTGICRLTRRSRVRISTRRTPHAPIRTQGASSNHKNLALDGGEPAGHGIGRLRGGLTTKIHRAVDGRGRPLVNIVTGGQRNDGAVLAEVVADIYVPRIGAGRPRTRPDTVLADKAYATGVNRTLLRDTGIKAVIPEKSTQINSRKKRGRNGGRPPVFDPELYKDRNVVERSFAWSKQWRGLATR